LSGTRAKATALLAVLQLIALPASAQNRALDSLIPAQPTGYVNDFARILDPASAAAINDLVLRLKTATGAELAVVTLPAIGDQDASEVARTIGRRWRVGEKAAIGDSTRNAGAVLLVVPRQNHKAGTGHVRIETGLGLEGIVTDAAAGQIRDDIMGPDLQAEAYGPAVLKGVQALSSRIARGYGVSDTMLTRYQPHDDRTGGSPVGSSLIPILFFIVFMLLASGAGGRRRRRGVYWGGPWIGGGWGGGGGFGGGGGGFGGFGGGGGFSCGGAGGRF
jgi:uncharacterized protein